MTKPVVEINGLNLYYGEQQALFDIHMAIGEKGITALIGPSGCGKSTFLRTINRMNDMIPGVKIEGDVRVRERDIYRDDVEVEQLRKTVGMVFQHPTPFPKSIYDNVAYGPRIHGIRKKRTLDAIVERSLAQAALWDEVKDRLSASAAGLSGGQQQRLCIARTLAIEPDIILMDEPTSALDPVSTQKIEELLQTLRTRYSIVIVTHNMQQAARISDRTALFLNGQLLEYDDTATMFSNPSRQETEDYITGRFG